MLDCSIRRLFATGSREHAHQRLTLRPSSVSPCLHHSLLFFHVLRSRFILLGSLHFLALCPRRFVCIYVSRSRVLSRSVYYTNNAFLRRASFCPINVPTKPLLRYFLSRLQERKKEGDITCHIIEPHNRGFAIKLSDITVYEKQLLLSKHGHVANIDFAKLIGRRRFVARYTFEF